MYDEILIPIDGSGINKLSIEELDNVADDSSRVHLISIVDYSIFGEDCPADAEHIVRRDEEKARESLEKFKKELQDKGYETECSLVKGWPAVSVVDYAKNNNINLMIMTTHGNKHINKSVTHKVIDMSKKPVLVKGSV